MPKHNNTGKAENLIQLHFCTMRPTALFVYLVKLIRKFVFPSSEFTHKYFISSLRGRVT